MLVFGIFFDLFVFFFKQKTAYEMRISDWSSDVCSSDLPPHNLNEVVDGCIALIDNPAIEIGELMTHIPAPDFPTAGLLLDAAGLVDAYNTGRGRIVVRARTNFESIDRKSTRLNSSH